MEFYKIAIIVVVVYIIVYNLTLGFSLFNKKQSIVIHDCTSEDLQKIGFQSVINRYPANTINIEYNKDANTAVIEASFDIFMITGIEGTKRIQVNNTVYNGMSDSILITSFQCMDFRIEGEFKRQIVEGIHENTVLTFPEKKQVLRIKEPQDKDFHFVFKGGKTKVLNIVFIAA